MEFWAFRCSGSGFEGGFPLTRTTSSQASSHGLGFALRDVSMTLGSGVPASMQMQCQELCTSRHGVELRP